MAKTLKNWIIDAMLDEIGQLEGRNIYGADVSYEVFNAANCNGSYTCNTYESEQWIKEWFLELGDVVEDIKYNLGEEFIPNVFTESEKFQVVIMLEMAQTICANCDYINDNWNNEIEFTEDVLKLIESQILDQKD